MPIRYRKVGSWNVLEEMTKIYTDIMLPYPIKTKYLELNTIGLLTIHEGYAWNGASGPTIDTPDTIRGSLYHDALCQLKALGYISEAHAPQIHSLLRDVCEDDALVWIDKRKAAARKMGWFSRQIETMRIWLYEATFKRRFEAWYLAVSATERTWAKLGDPTKSEVVLEAP